MGASSITLKAAYDTHVVYMRPAYDSPGPIDKSNWKDHLGDEQCVISSFVWGHMTNRPSQLLPSLPGVFLWITSVCLYADHT